MFFCKTNELIVISLFFSCSTNHGASSELHEVELLTGLPGMTGHVQNSREEEQMALRSRSSNIYSFVRFVNRTLRKVDIIWLNYEGSRVKYKTLAQDQFVDVNTFVGHPWIFRDADTGDRLLVKLCEVYQPVGFASAEGCLPQRKVINITIPGKLRSFTCTYMYNVWMVFFYLDSNV